MQEHADPEAVRVELQAQVERALKAGIDVTHVDTHMGTVAQLSQQLEAQGLPLFDQMVAMPLDESADRVQVAKKLFDALPAGLSYFVLHPALDTPELRAIAPDWPSRVADYQAFTSAELRDHVKSSGLHVVGYRALRDMLRASAA